MKNRVFVGLLVCIMCLGEAAFLYAQAKNTIAPDQIPGAAVYIPFPVNIQLDGKLDDWKGVPVQHVDKGPYISSDPKQNTYFDFSLAADNDELYVLMTSMDTNIVAGQHRTDFWNEDSLEVYVNFTANLDTKSYAEGIAQVTINATNIGNGPVDNISVSGTNGAKMSVSAKVFKTADGWGFEAAIPFKGMLKPSHGGQIGFQAHANGATKKDRDSKLIWGKLDTGDQSYRNPALFGRGIFFKVGSMDIPVPETIGKDIAQTFKADAATGKTGRKLVWSDEFDGKGEFDKTKWTYDAFDSGKYNNELQLYTDSRANSFVENGMLTIRAIKDAAGKWTSARIFTKGLADWKYGYFEIRAKLPSGLGTWPAIWMMPAKDVYGGWPDSGEIDIMEFVGFEPDTIHTTVHTKAYNHILGTQQGRAAPIAGVSQEFHTYAVEWTPKGIYWYVDSIPFYFFQNEKTGSATWPYDQNFFLILNLAMGGNWGGQRGMDPALKSAEMIVDYVRVYQ